MKLELKTENENNSKSISYFFCLVFVFTIVIIFCDIALKLGIISKHYEIDYNCKLLTVDKSTNIFKNLSGMTNLKSKQQIWEFCRQVVK